MLNRIQVFLGFLPDKLVTGICTCGQVGYWGKAPGTNGTILGIAIYTVLFFPLGNFAELVLACLLAAMAIVICDEGERRLKKRDPGEIIIDEVVAVPFCFMGLKSQMLDSGYAWAYMLGGFLLFRIYDIAKPLGIKRLQRYPGGVGVVVDDLAAAVATNITLRLFAIAFTYGNW